MKNKLMLTMVSLLVSVPALAMDLLNVGVYPCSYSTDMDRVQVPVRAELHISDDTEGRRACLVFVTASNRGGKTCGSYNPHYGVRKDGHGIFTIRFDGYEDYIRQSGVSIPPARRRFAIVDQTTHFPRFILRGDRREAPDASYQCSAQQ